MSSTWVVVASVAVVCFGLRATPPFLLVNRRLPEAVDHRLHAAIPAVLAALVAVQTAGAGDRLVVDARAGGVATAAAVFVWRRSLVLAVAAAAAAAALVRAV